MSNDIFIIVKNEEINLFLFSDKTFISKKKIDPTLICEEFIFEFSNFIKDNKLDLKKIDKILFTNGPLNTTSIKLISVSLINLALSFEIEIFTISIFDIIISHHIKNKLNKLENNENLLCILKAKSGQFYLKDFKKEFSFFSKDFNEIQNYIYENNIISLIYNEEKTEINNLNVQRLNLIKIDDSISYNLIEDNLVKKIDINNQEIIENIYLRKEVE